MDNYKQLSHLLTNNLCTISYLKETQHWNDIFYSAVLNYDVKVIEFLIYNTDYLTWLDINSLKTYINNKIDDNTLLAPLFSWAMAIDNIRQLFTPEEKGRFVHLALTFKRFTLLTDATKDKDWSAYIKEETLYNEIYRLLHDKKSLNIDYINWAEEYLLKKVDNPVRLKFMLCLLAVYIEELDKTNTLKTKIDNGYINILLSNDLPSHRDNIQICITYIKKNIFWDKWNKDVKERYLDFIVSSQLSSQYNDYIVMSDLKDKADLFFHYIQPIVLSTQLEKELTEKNTTHVSATKIKL